MKWFLHNNSLQCQCVFDHIESIFSSHTVCVSHQFCAVYATHDVCDRLIFFRWFQIGWFDFSQHILVFQFLNWSSDHRTLSLLVPFLQQLLIVLNFVYVSVLSFIIFIHSVIILKFYSLLCNLLIWVWLFIPYRLL